ncbi:MAG: hypothetical protein RLZZ155_839 [Bacteroidota bacterium]
MIFFKRRVFNTLYSARFYWNLLNVLYVTKTVYQ